MVLGAAADLVVVVHMAFLVFVGIGSLVARRARVVRWFHAGALTWAAVAIAAGLPCPLTALEKWLRAGAGQAPYTGGFVDRYVEGVVYPEALTRPLWVLVAIAALIGHAGLADPVVRWLLGQRSAQAPTGAEPVGAPSGSATTSPEEPVPQSDGRRRLSGRRRRAPARGRPGCRAAR